MDVVTLMLGVIKVMFSWGLGQISTFLLLIPGIALIGSN
ncbi:hypothetical protein SAMN05216308_1113 [Nitrosospira sp. Nsp13]|nr:hypothetical protein SAMN05216308_1113 [Nitrosospira sp. Nsp13]